MVRLAHHFFSALVNKNDKAEKGGYNEVGLPRALQMFYDDKLTGYFLS